TEIPSPAAGTLLEIKVAEDETVEVGTELAVIGAPDGAGPPSRPAQEQPAPAEPVPEQPSAEQPSAEQPAAERPAAEPPAPAEPAPAREPSAPAPPAPSGDGAPYVTPLVRRLAAQHGVDLSTVTGTGVGGRIRKQDVLAAAETAKAEPAKAEPAKAEPAKAEPAKAEPGAPAPAAEQAPAPQPSPLRGTTEKLSRIRAVIAKRVHESLQNTAQLTTVVEVD